MLFLGEQPFVSHAEVKVVKDANPLPTMVRDSVASKGNIRVYSHENCVLHFLKLSVKEKRYEYKA